MSGVASKFRPCIVCEPRGCERTWLYVVEDEERGLVKIGTSTNIRSRMRLYSPQGRLPIHLRYKARAGCEFRALTLEATALRRMRRVFANPSGDWFAAPFEAAVAAVQHVCEHSYTKHRP